MVESNHINVNHTRIDNNHTRDQISVLWCKGTSWEGDKLMTPII